MNGEFVNASDQYRGEIWSVQGNATYGSDEQHNILIVSTNAENKTKPYVMAVSVVDELKSKARPSRFPVVVRGDKIQYVICESVRRVSVNRILKYQSSISEAELERLDLGLKYALGIGDEHESKETGDLL